MQDEKKEDASTLEARQHGPLKGIVADKLKSKFSSTPIEPEKVEDDDTADRSSVVSGHSLLTAPERDYLELLLRKGDQNSLTLASQRLNDPTLFPTAPEEQEPAANRSSTSEEAARSKPALKRRNSLVQQHLFRLHETQACKPSQMLQRMTFAHKNSILDSSSDNIDVPPPSAETTPAVADSEPSTQEELEGQSEDQQQQQDDDLEDYGLDWNPFKDITSWLDGSQGIEVNEGGEPLQKQEVARKASAPFRILGTAADDASCHPHVLSPPVMESLLAFVPEGLSQCNFWLKYSLVRDGPSLWTILKQVRASTHSFLAIETVDGKVFGSFTGQSWRMAQGWYGSQDTFLWKMRRPRLHTTRSIVQQVYQESEIQVYPYRPGNVAIQYCGKECLMLGRGELLPTKKPGKHYGHGLYLDASLERGTTSSSETFGNPCLTNADQRGERFEVSNIEIWTLTPRDTVAEAEQSELSTLFLEGGRASGSVDLSFLRILVGGPI